MSSLTKWIPIKGCHAKAVLKRTLKLAAAVVFGGLTMGIILLVIVLNGRPDLKVWHKAKLDAEFTKKSEVDTLDGYLELEDALFAQLKEEVYDKIEDEDKRELNRYQAGSYCDPEAWPQNWNRTWVAESENPTEGILLLHGLSDSPYSMRTLGERLADGETAVVALRVPGHGTAPCGLLDVRWEDMAAAVKMGVKHLREEVGDGPITIIGYSNGGALAVEYALSMIEDDTLPRVEKLVLLSPMIGVTKMAALAVWQSRLGRVLGLEKLGWNSILPEYEPYKYGSFALNAGRLSYLLTDTIRTRIKKAKSKGLLENFPPVLAFQSAVDATVSAAALVEVLFESLPDNGHELVLFDINRRKETESVFSAEPTPGLAQLRENRELPFTLTLLENENAESRVVVERTRTPGGSELVEKATGLTWPELIYSLSHVALPFPETDAVYGGEAAEEYPGIQIGNLVGRGERGVLQIPASTMLRLRWNPFFDYMEGRILPFLGRGDTTGPAGS